MRFGQWPNRTNLKLSFLAENIQLAESYIIFCTFRPVAESHITHLYVSANYFLAETYDIRFGQRPNPSKKSLIRPTDKDHWFDMSIRDLTWATVATKLATLPPIFGGLICLSCPLVCVLLSTYCVRPTFPRPTVPRKNNSMNYLRMISTIGGIVVIESTSWGRIPNVIFDSTWTWLRRFSDSTWKFFQTFVQVWFRTQKSQVKLKTSESSNSVKSPEFQGTFLGALKLT